MISQSAHKLTEDYDALSRLAHAADEPIYIEKDGEVDSVLMSPEYYESHFTKKMDKDKLPSCGTETDRQEETNVKEYTEMKLGKILKLIYDSAPRGRQTTMIHLFGVYYADIIKQKRLGQKEIIRAAGLSEPYKVEINKGVNLSEYVTINEEAVRRIREIEAQVDNRL